MDSQAPGTDYFYRFRTGGHVSPSRRTRASPDRGSLAPVTMCVASCANYQQGWFTAYRRLAEEHPDLVVHLGDYQYEYAASEKGVRAHAGPETVSLAHYPQRYAQYKTDPDLQAAHAVAPWRTNCDERELPSATLIGAAQERWLLNGFQRSRSRWDILGQQVFFSQVEFDFGALTIGQRLLPHRNRSSNGGDHALRMLRQVQPGEPQDLPTRQGDGVLPLPVDLKRLGIRVKRPAVGFDGHPGGGKPDIDLVACNRVVRPPAGDTRIAQEFHEQALGCGPSSVVGGMEQAAGRR